jgi:hypothetical protein
MDTQTAERLGKFLRLLSSDRDGEVVAAARAIIRTLHGAGMDVHALADAVGANGRKYTEAQVTEIYQAGVADGERKAMELARANAIVVSEDDDGFHDIEGSTSVSWTKMAEFCYARINRLASSHHGFVRDMKARPSNRRLTEKQLSYLRSLYTKLGGRT